MVFILARRSSAAVLVSPRSSRIFVLVSSSTSFTLGFCASVRLHSVVSLSRRSSTVMRPPLPLPLPDVSASAARTIVLLATKPPSARAAIRLILLNFMLPLFVCFCCSAHPSFAAADGFYTSYQTAVRPNGYTVIRPLFMGLYSRFSVRKICAPSGQYG